jgi:16S rRNA (guanine527-N7)-methyltransferase
MLLDDYLVKIALSLTTEQKQKLFQHIELLHQWNQRINITAVKKDEMVEKHIIDSLSIVHYFSSYKRVADIGTGGGFPGLPLAIVYPENHYILIDSNNKKCGFLRYVTSVLGLKNVSIVHTRVEDYSLDKNVDAIICRALSSPQNVYNLCVHLVKKNGKIFVMFSKNYKESWENNNSHTASKQWKLHKLMAVPVLGERYLLEYSKVEI